MTALMPRRRKWQRMAREEYALPARTASGVILGRPIGRGTRRRAITCVNAGASPAWPGVMWKARGLQRPSQVRWIADVEADDWEEVVEVSVHAPAGDLKVESLDLGPDTEVQSLSPSGPDWYRLRVHARGRENLRDKVSMEPVEDYLLVVWQDPPADPSILRSSEYIELRLQSHIPQSE